MTQANGAPSPQTLADVAPSAPPRSLRRRPFVLAMIGLAATIFLIAATLLYYHWAAMREPNCILVVNFSPDLKGADVNVDGFPLTHSLSAKVGENDRYALPFYLDAGTYTVKVTLAGEKQYERDIAVSRNTQSTLDLTKLEPNVSTTLPSSGAGSVGGVGGVSGAGGANSAGSAASFGETRFRPGGQ